MKKMKTAIMVYGMLGAIVSSLAGVTFSGSSTTTFYGFEKDVKHSELYQNFALDFVEIGTRNLSIHTHFRVRKDLSTDESIEPKFRNAYINWKGNLIDVRAGRQFVRAGVGKANLDGLKLRFHKYRLFSLITYAGTESPADSIKVGRWSEKNILGAYFSLDCIKNSIFGISWIRKERNEEVDWQAVGLDADGHIRNVRLYSKLGFDMLREKINSLLIGIGYSYRITSGLARGEQSRKIRVYTEFLRQTPTFRKSSLFSTFDVESTSQLRIGTGYSLWKGLDFLNEYSVTFFEANPSHRLWIAIRKGHYTIGYIYSAGYGGTQNGLNASLRLAITDKFDIYGFGIYSKYKLSDRETQSSEDVAIHLGVNYKVIKNWVFSAGVENLRNRVYEYDTRVLLKSTIRFR